jgi:hypothetical protein
MSDMKMMQYERSEALFASLAEFRVLLGDLDNVGHTYDSALVKRD